MSEQEDKKFAAFLRGSAEVSRAYRQLRDPPPPAHLDALIEGHARSVLPRAHTTLKQLNRPYSGKPSWFAPFALAASVLLSAAVLMAIAIDPQARGDTDAQVKLIRASAGRDDKAMLTHPAPGARAASRQSDQIVPRLIEPRRLYSTDPPGSHPAIERAPLPPMPVEVIRRDAGAWRARIEQLRRDGHTEQAEQEWREFLKVYPDQR